MELEYDYVTGDGHTVSWKRGKPSRYNVWAFRHSDGSKRRIGQEVDEKTLRAIIREFSTVILSRNRVAW